MVCRSLLLTGIAWILSCQSVAQATADDRNVIQVAMLTFFKPEEWHSADWKPKNHVVLRPMFSPKTRPIFSDELERAIAKCEREITNMDFELTKTNASADRSARLHMELVQLREDLVALRETERKMTDGQRYVPAAVVEPSNLTWDKRIIITGMSNRLFTKDRDYL